MYRYLLDKGFYMGTNRVGREGRIGKDESDSICNGCRHLSFSIEQMIEKLYCTAYIKKLYSNKITRIAKYFLLFVIRKQS